MGEFFYKLEEYGSKIPEVLQLANYMHESRRVFTSRFGDEFKVEMELPKRFKRHTIVFKDPFTCIAIDGKFDISDTEILMHYVPEVYESGDEDLCNEMVKSFRRIKGEMEQLKKLDMDDSIPAPKSLNQILNDLDLP